ERRLLDIEGEAPTAAALGSAREIRDVQWMSIRDAAISGRASAVADCEAFERALANVDHLADSRTEHAAQIERTASVHARAAKLRRERAEHDLRRNEHRERKSTSADEWAATWAATGLEAVAPDDAVGWLAEREAI